MNFYLIEINATLLRHPTSSVFFFFIVCACLGSYFNLFAWRWPQIQERAWLADIKEWFKEKGWPEPLVEGDHSRHLTLSRPRSFCPSCGNPIPMYYNVPVLGWVILGGRSACCSQPISLKYPLFEMVCGGLGAGAWLHYQHIWPACVFLLFAMPLCMASQTDFESKMLPDSVNAFILFTGLGLNIFGLGPLTPQASFAGAALGFGSLWLIRAGGSVVFRREAMGFGDLKLFAGIGAWIGAQMLPNALLVASVIAVIFAITSKLVSKTQKDNIVPFGPFLSLGGLASYVFGAIVG